MPDKPEKKTETPKPEPKVKADPKAEHMAALRKYGSRICPECHGIGRVRSEPGHPRTECKACHGVGSVPCPEGELEGFIMQDCERAPVSGLPVVKAGWERFAADHQVRAEQQTRCYHYMKVGADLPTKIVTEAQIDAAFKAGGKAAVLALAVV